MTSVYVASYKPTAIGRLLAERRARANISQDELARATNVARTAIANIESGKTRVPSVELVNAIARVLPVTVREMLTAIGYAVEEDTDLTRRMLAVEDEVRDVFRRYFGEGDAPTSPG